MNDELRCFDILDELGRQKYLAQTPLCQNNHGIARLFTGIFQGKQVSVFLYNDLDMLERLFPDVGNQYAVVGPAKKLHAQFLFK